MSNFQLFWISFLILFLIVRDFAIWSLIYNKQAAIDLDQRAIETQLALGTDQGRQAALAVYSQGAFSKSYAEVTLTSGLQVDVAKDTTVMGATADGKQVRASTMADTKAGDTVLMLQYHASPVQASWTDCHVGGNPEPNTNGCE